MGTTPSRLVGNALRQGSLSLNACQLQPRAVRVLGEGTSNTIVVFVDLLNHPDVVAKIWMAPLQPSSAYCPALLGLDYEAAVYEYVGSQVFPEAPFFVPFVGVATCTRANLTRWAGPHVEELLEEMRDIGAKEVVEKELERKAKAARLETITDRLARARRMRQLRVEARAAVQEAIRDCTSEDRFRILLTRRLCENCSLGRWLHSNPDEALLRQVVLQVLFACVVLEQHRVYHNDLHLGNVLVWKRPAAPVGLRVRDLSFRVPTHVQPVIFDWDHAYVEKLGPNPLLTTDVCQQTLQCNRASPGFDAWTFLCKLVPRLGTSYPETTAFVQRHIVCQSDAKNTFADLYTLLADPYFTDLRGEGGVEVYSALASSATHGAMGT